MIRPPRNGRRARKIRTRASGLLFSVRLEKGKTPFAARCIDELIADHAKDLPEPFGLWPGLLARVDAVNPEVHERRITIRRVIRADNHIILIDDLEHLDRPP